MTSNVTTLGGRAVSELPESSQEWLQTFAAQDPANIALVEENLARMQTELGYHPSMQRTFFDLLDEPVRALEALGIDPNENIAFRCLIDNEDDRAAYALHWRRATQRYGSYFDSMFGLFRENIGEPRAVSVSDGRGMMVDRPTENPEPPRGIFFTVNRTNGEGVGNEHVIETRAIFMDDDTNALDMDEVFDLCEPSLVVRTRNGRHVYWRVDDLPVSGFSIVQKSLANHFKTDISVNDPARILRLPGFFHQKRRYDPYLVSIEHDNGDIYATEDVVEALGVEIREDQYRSYEGTHYFTNQRINREGDPNPTKDMIESPFRMKGFKIALAKCRGAEEGGRNHKTYQAACVGHEYGLAKDELREHLHNWNLRNNTPPLPEHEVDMIIHSAYKHARSEFGQALLACRLERAFSESTAFKQFAQPQIQVVVPVDDQLIERVIVPETSYVGEVVTKLEHNTVYLMCCPHGKGKTHVGKRLIDSAPRALFISPTVALSIAGAERMEIPCYTDSLDVEAKIATTMNSLPSLSDPEGGYDVVMVDEIDQCLDYVQTGRVPNALSVVNKMWAAVAHSKTAILASADFTEDYMQEAIKNIREHAPKKRIVIVTQKGEPGKLTLDVMGITDSKAEMKKQVMNHERGGAPYIIFCTGKQWAPRMAETVRRWRSDLQVLSISSENSRLDEIQDKLRNPNKMLQDYDVLILSPAVKSGVSFTLPVRKVHVHHTAREVTAETMCQMPMRARNLEDTVVTYGMNAFTPEEAPVDRAILMGIANRTSQFIEHRVHSRLPDYKTNYQEGNQPLDELFTDQWCLTEKRSRLSYNNPLQRLCEVGKFHNWNVWTSRMEQEPSGTAKGRAKKFNEAFSEAAVVVDERRVEAILDAVEVDAEEMRKLQRKSRLTRDEQNQMRRAEVRDFYGHELLEAQIAKVKERVTSGASLLGAGGGNGAESLAPEERDAYIEKKVERELIEKDERGQYREICRSFNRAVLESEVAEGDPHATKVAGFLDYESNKGRQKTQYRLHCAKATMVAALFHYVTGLTKFGKACTVPASVIRQRSWEFFQANYTPLTDLFRSKLKSDTHATRWFNTLMKKHGAVVDSHTKGEERHYTFDFTEVAIYAEHERKCFTKRYEDMKDQKEMNDMVEVFHQRRAAAGPAATVPMVLMIPSVVTPTAAGFSAHPS